MGHGYDDQMLKRSLSQIRSGKAKHLRLNCAHSLFLLGFRKFTLSMPRNMNLAAPKKTVCVKFNKDKTKFAEFLSAAVWVKIEKLILLQLSDGIKWFQTTFGPFWRQLTGSRIIVFFSSSPDFPNKWYSPASGEPPSADLDIVAEITFIYSRRALPMMRPHFHLNEGWVSGCCQKLPKVGEMLRGKKRNLEFSNHPMVEGPAVFLETIVRKVFAYGRFRYDFHQIWTLSTHVRDIFSLRK